MTNNDLRLMAYVDGELDAAAAREVETLLAADPEARRAIEKYRESAALLRAACAEAFYADGSVRVPPAPARPITRAVRRFASYAAVAAAAAMIGFGGGWVSSGLAVSDRQHIVDEVADYHSVQSLETKHLVEVPATEATDLTTWLGRRLERHLAVPDLAPVGLHFAGGRMVVIDRKPVAALIYTRDNGPPVALCIVREASPAAGVRIDQRDDQSLASWSDGAYTYVVVGHLTDADARAIADRAAPQLRS